MWNKKAVILFFIGLTLAVIGFLGNPYLSITVNDETNKIELLNRIR